MKAVVLAGGVNIPELMLVTKEKFRANIKLNGKPMLDYVISALGSSKKIESIDVYVNRENKIILNGKKVRMNYSDRGPLDNVEDFLKRYSNELENTHVLLCTSDIPLLNSEIIDDFIKKGLDMKQPLVVPIVVKDSIVKEFPNVKRAYIPIENKCWSIGNLCLINSDFYKKIQITFRAMFDNRKSVIQSAKIFGWVMLFKLILKKMDFDYLANQMKKRYGFPLRPLIFNHPEIVMDVDKVSDYKIISSYLKEKTI